MIEIELKGIQAKDLSGIYKDIAENFGVEIALMIFNHFKGLQVTFPTRFLDIEYIKRQLRKENNGNNMKLLARKYGYSERWIRELIKTSESNHPTQNEED